MGGRGIAGKLWSMGGRGRGKMWSMGGGAYPKSVNICKQ